jgi:hypothetical protein
MLRSGMAVWLCRIDASPPCGWSSHGFKHFPFEGMTPRHTHHAPARYLPGLDIRALETETVRQPEIRLEQTPSKTEYLRDMQRVIGWDMGQDATLSFVECTGGDRARTLHGRPMHVGNIKATTHGARGSREI